MKNFRQIVLIMLIILANGHVFAIDSDVTRQTMAKMKGVRVVVEDLQSNIKKYANKFNINQEQITKLIEEKLRKSGISVLSYDEWVKTLGRPMIYVNINTHENEKYLYAYDIKFELLQVVSPEINPDLKTMASTWSLNLTGVLNIGNLSLLKQNISHLTDRFIEAYFSVNKPFREKRN